MRDVPASAIASLPLRTTLTVAACLAIVCAGILGAGMLADMVPDLLAVAAMLVLGVLALAGLWVAS